jgi:hypothetical protein
MYSKLQFMGLSARFTATLLASSIFLSSCASTTVIQSSPPHTKLYLNGEPVGVTPYTHTDTRIVGSTTVVRLEKEGYQTLHTSFARDEEADVGAIIGGIFFLVPFLWIMKYKPHRYFELIPLTEAQEQMRTEEGRQPAATKPKAERLKELKQLLDEHLITEEEYDRQRAEILREK